MVIYENIVNLCKKDNISIRALELTCNLGNGTISGWKNSSPRVDLLDRVAKHFNVTVNDLMREDA